MTSNSKRKLIDTLNCLTYALTNRLPYVTDHQLDELLEGHEFYLPDGGYSRLVVSIWDGKAFLTSNSLDKPKEAWTRCKELISDLEKQVHKCRVDLDPTFTTEGA